MRPAAGSLTRGGYTSAVRTSLVAGQLQAASVPIAYAAAPRSQRFYSLGWDRQTDERIAVSVIAPLRRGNNIGSHDLEGGGWPNQKRPVYPSAAGSQQAVPHSVTPRPAAAAAAGFTQERSASRR